MSTDKITVNADRLFSKVGRYFGSVSSALSEAVQNAYRSYCPIAKSPMRPPIDIMVTGRDVTITDGGRGIRNFASMLSLASSDWEADVEGDQDPAGLGVCGILAYCDSATWESGGLSLTVNGKSFLSSAAYRDELLSHIRTADANIAGTRLTMHNVHGSDDLVTLCTAAARWYRNVYIRVNGKAVSLEAIPGVRCGSLAGSDIYLSPDAWVFDRNFPSDSRVAYIFVLWHGALIPVRGVTLSEPVHLHIKDSNKQAISGLTVEVSPCSTAVLIIDVGADAEAEGTVTPKLPDRSGLVLNDMTLATLKAAWRIAAVERTKQIVEFYDTPVVRTKGAYRRFTDGPGGVAGWDKVYPHRNLVVCGTTEVHSRAGDRDGELVERVVCRSEILGSITSSSAHLVIRDGGEETIRSFSHHWGTCVVAGDESSDPFAEEGYYRVEDAVDVPSYVVVVIVDAKSKDDKYPVYVETGSHVRVWLVPELEVEANGVSTALTSPNAVEFLDASDISFTETEATGSSLAEDIVIVTAHEHSDKTYVASTAINEWRDYYRARLQEEVRSCYDNGDSDAAKQVEDEYNTMWEDQLAEWKGAVRIFNLLRDIRAKLPTGVKGVSVSFPVEKTVECTMADGSISTISIE